MTSSFIATQEEEKLLWRRGYAVVAGIDEVGRGALAGPVVAAAVILPDFENIESQNLGLIKDSKTLSEKRREIAARVIRSIAIAIGIGEVSSSTIDEIGIGPATSKAMLLALGDISIRPDYLLIDGNVGLNWESVPCKTIIKGDKYCSAIAAASLIAKVHRDGVMREFSISYPSYKFDRNKGYGVNDHLTAIEKIGICPIHRRSFAPINKMTT